MARKTEHRAERVQRARRWINANPAQVLVVCVACVLLLMTVLRSHHAAPPPAPTHEWYYDTVTGQLVAEPMGGIPPIERGGGEMWLARVYSCGHCADSFIGYFEKMKPEAKRRLDELKSLAAIQPLTEHQETEVYDLHMTGWLCSMDGKQWQPKDAISEEELMLHLGSRCADGLKWCLPGPDDLP